MDRNSAIVIFVSCWLVFYLISYYGASIFAWSSFCLSLFLSVIALNIIYPPSKATTDPADYSLGVYIAIEILAVLILAIFIIQKAFVSYRSEVCNLL